MGIISFLACTASCSMSRVREEYGKLKDVMKTLNTKVRNMQL